LRVSMNEAIPLVLRGSRIPARYEVIKALMLSEIKWQIRFESNDQSSLVSALHAGLGIGAGFRRLKAHVGLNRLPQQIKLPELPEIDVVMVGPGLASSAILRAVTLFLEKAATLSHHAEVLELYPTH
jgi:DNA-binding transcriptional LysR family regulator